MTKFICYGEVLWDLLLTGKVIGGAPLNVAYRLSSFGNETQLISKIGQDDYGHGIIDFLKQSNLNTNLIQTDKGLPTGIVKVTLDNTQSATYDIVNPVAWDNIELNKDNTTAVKNANVFIYGSLSARETQSRDTLLELLKLAKYKVFDVNLRAPHYNREGLITLMEAADFIKLNNEELHIIAGYYDCTTQNMEHQIKTIATKTHTKMICVTKGSNGAILYDDGKFYSHNGYSNKVIDTVGAGDAFLATLLHFKTQEIDLQNALNYACAMGALVVNTKGGTTLVGLDELIDFSGCA